MNMSTKVARMVLTLRRYYSAELIGDVLRDAEVKAHARGGRQITRADWDAVMDEQPLDGGYRIVGSNWVGGLEMLMARLDGQKGGSA